MNTAEKPATVIAVTSGKGGVGKTNVVANLGLAFAASNKKTVLIDADLGLGNLDIIMNINSMYNLWHVARGTHSIEEIIQVGPNGVEVVCGPNGLEDMANLNQFQRSRLIEEMDKFHCNSDIILIDTSAGINQSVLAFCSASDQVLVVTTPEPSAMSDAYAMIKILSLQDYPGKICLVVNMAASLSEGKRVYRQMADVAHKFLSRTVYEAGILCMDERLPKSVKARKPFVLNYPQSNVTSAFTAMAARLSRGCRAGETARNEGFFRKVVNLFF